MYRQSLATRFYDMVRYLVIYVAAISWRGGWKEVRVGRGSAEQLKGILQFSHYAPQGLEGIK